MKITMVRHEKVDMQWSKKYNSVTYDLACDKYDRCPIVFSQREYFDIDDTKPVYISELSRTYETACRLYKKTEFCKTAFLNEVPLRSFRDTDKIYPLWLWNLAGRVQWLLQSERQAETKKDTVLRAKNDRTAGRPSAGLLSGYPWLLYENTHQGIKKTRI